MIYIFISLTGDPTMEIVEPEASYLVRKQSAQDQKVNNFTSQQGLVSIPPITDQINPTAQQLDFQVTTW